MNSDLDSLVQVLQRTYNLDVSPYDGGFLAKTLDRRRLATQCATTGAYLDHLAHNGEEAEAFCRLLTVSHSEFFRDPLAIALLEQVVLPGLRVQLERAGRAEIRVWCAACAAGQEAYSIAILLDELSALPGVDIFYRIFATDNDADQLSKARHGVYDAPAVQNVRLGHLSRYFTPAGDGYAISPRLRDRVDFSSYDLLDRRIICPPASIYGGFDLVLCSNVLYYYNAVNRRVILDKVYDCLAPNGYLVTDPAERGWAEVTDGFRAVAVPAAIFQKTDRGR